MNQTLNKIRTAAGSIARRAKVEAKASWMPGLGGGVAGGLYGYMNSSRNDTAASNHSRAIAYAAGGAALGVAGGTAFRMGPDGAKAMWGGVKSSYGKAAGWWAGVGKKSAASPAAFTGGARAGMGVKAAPHGGRFLTAKQVGREYLAGAESINRPTMLHNNWLPSTPANYDPQRTAAFL